MNPGTEAKSAGALIDAAGLRGLRNGTAVVTEKHANFIQSDPGGRADDVIALMCHVQDIVQQHHGIRMRSEVTLIGFDPDISARFADDVRHDPNIARAQDKLGAIVASGDQVS